MLNLLKNNANCVYLQPLIWLKSPNFVGINEEY